ncbi:MAG: magnesium-dependent phosphatase-1 [Planctomycetota bacterium]
MLYRLIVFDLDETLWTIRQTNMQPVKGPFRLVNSHEAVGQGSTVTLFRGVRTLLRNLERRDKFVSLASRSDPDVCEELLRLFGVHHCFLHPQFGWQEKSTAVTNVLKAFRDIGKEHITPQEVLFIDDWPANVEAVRGIGAATLLFGRDIRSIQELAVILE